MDLDRHSLRLKGYDYAQAGAYFVTLCTHDRMCLLGNVRNGEMRLNSIGDILSEEWARTSDVRQEMELDAFVIMPNHLHGIVITRFDPRTPIVGVGDDATDAQDGMAHGRAPLRRLPRSLGSFVAGFKSVTTKRVNQFRGTPGAPLWQRNYYEHVIRDEKDLNRIRAYIIENPARWEEDQYHVKP